MQLRDIESQLEKLEKERDSLVRRQQRQRDEELKVLADAYARKLEAAGLTVRQGIEALKPYVKMKAAMATPTTAVIGGGAKAPLAARVAAAAAPADLAQLAAQALGKEAANWLKQPHLLLGGQTPEDMAATPGGRKKVLDLLAAYGSEN